MARVCGRAHEISGIPAPLWLCGWVVLGSRGWGGRVWCGRVGWPMAVYGDRGRVGEIISGLTWGGYTVKTFP